MGRLSADLPGKKKHKYFIRGICIMIKCTITENVATIKEGKICYENITEVKVFASVKSLNNYKDELAAKHIVPIKTEIKPLFFKVNELFDAIAPLCKKLDSEASEEIENQVVKAFITGCLVERSK